MARIRTIKPEFWVSEQVAECSPTARLLFIGLWNFCDDGGVIPYKPKMIKAQVFPADDFTQEIIRRLVDELLATGLLVSFEADGQTYLFVTGWKKHQRIEKVNIKYPRPPADILDGRAQLSLPIRRPVDDHSPPEGKGREGKGEEGKGREERSTTASETMPATTAPPTKPAPLFVQIIGAFDEARAKAFGENQRRSHPHQDDASFAKRFVEAGADLDLCRQVFGALCERAKAKGKRPPWSLEYFESAIADAIATRDRPMPEGRAQANGSGNGEPASTAIQTRDQIRAQMQERAKTIARGIHLNSVSNEDVGHMVKLGWVTAEQAAKAGYEP